MKRKWRLCSILLLLAVLVSIWTLSASADMVGDIQLEQVYLNAPQCKFFVYVGADSGSYEPESLALAGLQMTLDEDQLELVDIQASTEPITYICVLDTQDTMSTEMFEASKDAILRLAENLQSGEQLLVFDADEKPVLVADRNTPRKSLNKYFSKLKQTDKETALLDTILYVGEYLDRHYQENTSRKVCYTFVGGKKLSEDPTILGAMKQSEVVDPLGMSIKILVDYQNSALEAVAKRINLSDKMNAETVARLLTFMMGIPDGTICYVKNDRVWDTMQAENAKLKEAVTITCRVSDSKIDGSVKVAAFNLPRLKITRSKYVTASHTMVSPAIIEAELIDRNHIQVNFSRPIYGAENPAAYIIRDTVGSRVPVYEAEPNEGGTSAVLRVGNLYDGHFNLHFKNGIVTDREEKANKSSTAVADLNIREGYPRDFNFYWRFLRMPALLLLLSVMLMLWLNYRQRKKEREDEANAQAETLLGMENKDSKEPTWFSVDYDGDGVVDAYVHDAFASATPETKSFSSRREGLASRQFTILVDVDEQTSRREDVTIEGSCLLGSDPDQTDLAVKGEDVLPQHAILYLEKNRLMLAPVGDAPVQLGTKPVTEPVSVPMGTSIRLGGSRITVKKYQGGTQDEIAEV